MSKTKTLPAPRERIPLPMPQNAVIFDAEIIRCIPDPKTPMDPAYDYCVGWKDYLGMGISCICCFDMLSKTPHVFLRDNFDDFKELIDGREYIIGFNSQRFDDALLQAHGIKIRSTYDLHVEYKLALGYNANSRISGTKLHDISMANFGQGKTEEGSSTPKLWQDGYHGRVINYCMNDVMMTLKLMLRGHRLVSSLDQKVELPPLRSLFEAKHEGLNSRMAFD